MKAKKKFFSSYREQNKNAARLCFVGIFFYRDCMEWEKVMKLMWGSRLEIDSGRSCKYFYWCIITEVINIAPREQQQKCYTKYLRFHFAFRLRPENRPKTSINVHVWRSFRCRFWQFIDWLVAFFTLYFCCCLHKSAEQSGLWIMQMTWETFNGWQSCRVNWRLVRLDFLQLCLRVIISRNIRLLIKHEESE